MHSTQSEMLWNRFVLVNNLTIFKWQRIQFPDIVLFVAHSKPQVTMLGLCWLCYDDDDDDVDADNDSDGKWWYKPNKQTKTTAIQCNEKNIQYK